MDNTATHISSGCTITNGTVTKNGVVLFTAIEHDTLNAFVEIYKYFDLTYSKFYKMDNLSKLGWLAAEILLKDTFIKDNYQPQEVGVVLANANSSLDSDTRYMASVANIPSPALFVYTLPNIMIGEICIRNQFKGESAFFISESFDALFIQQYVTSLFDNHTLKACICGWVDVIANEYKASLFLIEKGEGAIAFTPQNMDRVFNQ